MIRVVLWKKSEGNKEVANTRLLPRDTKVYLTLMDDTWALHIINADGEEEEPEEISPEEVTLVQVFDEFTQAFLWSQRIANPMGLV